MKQAIQKKKQIYLEKENSAMETSLPTSKCTFIQFLKVSGTTNKKMICMRIVSTVCLLRQQFN